MINLSIVIPVFNVAEYLTSCLNSLLNSDLSNTEIILVDDGSTDQSGIIGEKFSRDYENIRIIHKKNGGPSSARNVGIEKAKGKWLTFIDSDDLVVPNYVSILNQISYHTCSDIVMFRLKTFMNEKEFIKDNKEYVFDKTKLSKIGKAEALYNLTTLYYGNFSVNKIYKRSLFSNINYPNKIAYEDLSIMYKLVDACRSVSIYDQILYFYRQRMTSLSHSHKLQITKEITGIKAAYNFLNYLQHFPSNSVYIKKAIKLNNYFMFSQYLDFVYLLNTMRNDSKENYLNRVFFMDSIRPSMKVEGVKVTLAFYLYKKFPNMFTWIYSKIIKR